MATFQKKFAIPEGKPAGVMCKSANKYITKGFPVVVFSHGLSGHFFAYSGICSDLASHGYVVAAVEHKDGSALLASEKSSTRSWSSSGDNMTNMLMNGIPKTMKLCLFLIIKWEMLIRQRAKEVRQALDILHLLNEGGDVHDM
ncbi:platelet-activating factor acetylhydrolase-like [Gigantopelta aegis]|uniref:platelet-activating factor acetylhydrolase-like n=1 Tax=Gigantopelta aegis TaxID=1735272 RepID=UPI001B887CCD|nr:platelet-activating factor acetylhydrolase-like [Gigantopelta aegis]